MKFLVALAFFACASAKPQFLPYSAAYHGVGYHHGLGAVSYAAAAAPLAYHGTPALHYAAAPAVVAPAFSKTQYHAQDELGQASHGYAYPGQAHAVVRDAAGNERGSYAYINPEGQEIRVDYTAGHGGFQVASNALPVAPTHIATPLAAPLPVHDTPEVAAAKASHFAAHAEARARAHLRKKRGVVGVAPALTYSGLHTPALAYSGLHTPALAYSGLHTPALAYSGLHAPALHYSAYHHAPAVHGYSALAAPALAYSAVAAPAVVAAPTHAVRVAELTKIVNNPGHAVSYRVD